MLEVSLVGVGTTCSVSEGMRGQWLNDQGKQQMSMPPSPVVGFRLFTGIGVRYQRLWNLRLALRELDNQRAAIDSRFNVYAVTEMGIGFHHVQRGESWRDAGALVSRNVHMVRHPRGSYMASQCCFGSSHLTLHECINSNMAYVGKTIHARSRIPPDKWFLEKWSPPFMRCTEHLTELRARWPRCPPGEWKPDALHLGVLGVRGDMVVWLHSSMNRVPPVTQI